MKQNKNTIKKLNNKIAKENAAFEKLSPAKKRVAIARDVLAQLNAKRFIATPGNWAVPKGKESLLSASEAKTKQNKELQEIFSKIKTCNTCALGGLFVCAVESADKIKVKDLLDFKSNEEAPFDDTCDVDINEDDITTYLEKYFSYDQLAEIEYAFEQGGGALSGSQEALSFVDDVESPSERMRLIMENIVVNNGIFKPKKKPVAIYSTPGFKA